MAKLASRELSRDGDIFSNRRQDENVAVCRIGKLACSRPSDVSVDPLRSTTKVL